MMRRYTMLILLVLLSILFTGCDNSYAENDYDNDDKLTAKGDQCSKVGAVLESVKHGYSLKMKKFDGRYTLWSKSLKLDRETDVEIEMSASAGVLKLVYIDRHGNITTLAELDTADAKSTTVTSSVTMPKGRNAIKLVGYGCEDIVLKLLLPGIQ